MATQIYTNGVTLTDAAEFNKFDQAAYATLFSVTGTNTLAATGPASYSAYSSTGPIFGITPPFTNTTSTTLNITPFGGSALGAKNVFLFGSALIGGELVGGVPTAVMYDGTQLNIVGAHGTPSLANSLGGNVALSNTSLFFDGPTIAQGTVGKWFVSGKVTFYDASNAAQFNAKLWDGTTVIDSGNHTTPTVAARATMYLGGVISAPAGNLRISVQNGTTTNGFILFNTSGLIKDSTLTAMRIG